MKIGDNEIILYNTEDGKTEIKIILDSDTQTIWLNQTQMAALFNVSVKTVNEHVINIYTEKELPEDSTIRNFRIVRQEGSRDVEREITHYNLKTILAVGYRVRSDRGTQFRRWATEQLNEYLVKGFVMNDERLKDPGGWDYFDELLERIRDIRVSEKRFYQKIRDIIATTSVDYDKKSDGAREFFAGIQNKLIFAETGKTSAELIIERADGDLPNMGLTNWKSSRVRKGDITIAKNYLTTDEVQHLNRLSEMFLNFAEDRAQRRKEISLAEWMDQTQKFLEFNERGVLDSAGSRSRTQMEGHVEKEYVKFETNREKSELVLSEDEHIRELEETLKKLEKKKSNKESL